MRKVYLFIALALFGILALTLPLYDTPKRSAVDLSVIVEERRSEQRRGEYEELVRRFGERRARQIDSLRFPQPDSALR